MSLQVFLKRDSNTSVFLGSLRNLIAPILKNIWGCIKSCFEKLCNIHRTKVASDTYSVKKEFLVFDRVVKVTCFYID